MSDLSKLKEILDNQAERGIRDGYVRLEYKERVVSGRDEKDLAIDNINIGFVFTKSGRLLGAYNWKE